MATDTHHSHDHGNHAGHSHEAPKNLSFAFLVAIFLNMAFVVVELYYGYSSHSIALIADATHNFGDVFGLVLGFIAFRLSSKLPDKKFTFGFKSSTILATVVSSVVLLVATGGILWESVQKVVRPDPIEGNIVILVALIGVVINGVSAYLLSKGNKDLNVKSAFLHLVSDALVSIAVAVSGVVVLTTGFVYVDAIMSLVIGIIILRSTIKILIESLNLSLQGVPEGVDIHKIKSWLESLDGVIEVHDLHIWAMSTSENALTCHLVVADEHTKVDLADICHELDHDFGIIHPTIQIEYAAHKMVCKLQPDSVV
jgi:cobalt-zinc-cadmium efflux system protein